MGGGGRDEARGREGGGAGMRQGGACMLATHLGFLSSWKSSWVGP